MLKRELNREASARAAAPARRMLLLGTALGCSIAVFAASAPAHAGGANDACGAVTRNTGPNNPDAVTCTSAGNSYTSGISYDQQTSNPAPVAPNDLTVVLQGGASPVKVNSSGVGVSVTNFSGNIATLVSNAGVSVTSVSNGLYAGANGATASVQNDGSVSAGGIGVLAHNTSPNAATIQNTGTVTAVGAGLQASTVGFGATGVTITNSGALSVDNPSGLATGIQAGYTTGKATVTNSGAITVGAGATAPGTAFGINTNTVGDASVTNNAGGVVKATASDFAVGIRAGQGSKYWANGGAVTNAADVTAKATASNGSATGISAYSIGDGTTVTSTAGKITATGYNATGVRGFSSRGDVSITISGGSVTANGGSASGGDSSGAGIYGRANGGTVTITGLNTYATGGNIVGIEASGDQGVTITTGAVSTTGQNGTGVQAYSYNGPVQVTVSGAVKTTGDNAPGVNATGYNGAVTVNLNGSVSTSGVGSTGVAAYSRYGDVTVAGAGAITTTGAKAVAVDAKSYNGAVSVTLNGAVKTTGAGSATGRKYSAVYAWSHNGAVSVTGSGPITATGAYANGVLAYGQQTTIALSGPVVVSGAPRSSTPFGNVGVGAIARGDASVTVGSVTSSGVGAIALSESGTAAVTVNGAVKASGKYGVVAFAPGNASSTAKVTISSGASVAGYNGVLAFGSNAAVTNSGTITGTNGAAVSAGAKYGGASVTNTASGVINGAVRVSGTTSSVFNNAGVWNAAGTSYVGHSAPGPVAPAADRVAGPIGQMPVPPSGVINNTSTVNVAPGTTGPTTVTVVGLGTWNNAGTINISNGHTGDVLDLGTAAFNGQTGSALKIDPPKAAAASDEVLAGAVSGVTKVSVSQPGLIDIAGGTFFKGTSGTASNFVLAPGMAHDGFVDYAIGFDPSSVSWTLYGLPSHATFEALKLPQAGQEFAERSDEVWYWRTQEIRDAEAQGAHRDGFELWGQVYGGSGTENQTRGFTLSGVNFREDLSTRNSWAGVQFGVDHLSSWRGGKLLWGFTAGYLEQWSDFRGGGTANWASGGAGVVDQAPAARDQFDLKGLNLGGYLGWSRGGFFANGLAKADFAGADLHLNSIGVKPTTNTTTWSLNGEVGYRYGGPQFFFEPLAKVIAGTTDVQAWTGAGANVSYPGANNLQTSLGARAGGALETGPIKLTPYVGAYWVNETLAANRMTLVDGSALNLQDARPGGFARFDAGVTAKTASGVEGFAKIIADKGSSVSDVGGDVGLRWRW